MGGNSWIRHCQIIYRKEKKSLQNGRVGHNTESSRSTDELVQRTIRSTDELTGAPAINDNAMHCLVILVITN